MNPGRVAARVERGLTMGFGQAISAGFSKYINFRDRASRSEYWFWILFYTIGAIATGIIDLALGVQVTSGVFGLVMIIPNISVAVRRLHDRDYSGWWYLLVFIPLIGWLILFIWFCLKGTDGPNRFGPDPLADLAIPGAARVA
jgi:uncharacterized membrane protein YhaH (DUF805 family)